jgi:hypothetical protein
MGFCNRKFEKLLHRFDTEWLFFLEKMIWVVIIIKNVDKIRATELDWRCAAAGNAWRFDFWLMHAEIQKLLLKGRLIQSLLNTLLPDWSISKCPEMVFESKY